jgi:hypothetical protein
VKLSKSIRLSRLSIRDISNRTDYATSEALVESLHALRVTHNVPIERYLRDLTSGRVDSISFTKDTPYYYFFARKVGSSVAVTYKEASRVVEFSIPIEEIGKVLLA